MATKSLINTVTTAELRTLVQQRTFEVSDSNFARAATAKDKREGRYRHVFSRDPAEIIARMVLRPEEARYHECPAGLFPAAYYDSEWTRPDTGPVPEYHNRPMFDVELTPYGLCVAHMYCLPTGYTSEQRSKTEDNWYAGDIGISIQRDNLGVITFRTGFGMGFQLACLTPGDRLRVFCHEVVSVELQRWWRRYNAR